jgi:Flp pilus assembly CpaE family ATPase
VYSCTTTCLSDLDCRIGVTCNTGTNPPVCTFP